MQMEDLKVLISDDSILARKQLHDVLTSFGCIEVKEARDGAEAVDIFEEFKPDLVFLDIVMPKLDGVSVIKKIKAMHEQCQIVMVSSVGTKEQLTAAIEAGAKDFVQKPFSINQIQAIVNSIVEGR